MNRIILLIYISILFIGCSKSNDKYIVGVSQCSDDAWRSQMNKEIEQEATFYGNIDLRISSADNDSAKQIAQIEQFIEDDIDLLIVAPNEMHSITPVIERAYESGIPVVVVDRKIDSDKYTAYLGGNNVYIGKLAGDYVVSTLKGEGNVIELGGLSSSSAAMERHRGFKRGISVAPGINTLCYEDVQWEEDIARVKTDSLLRIYDDVDCIFGCNDRVAYGAYKAACDLGREKEMKFIGIDGLYGKNQGVELVYNGSLDASFLYPTGGNVVMETAYKILTNQHVNRDVELQTAIIDSLRAHITIMQMRQISALDDRIETLNVRVTNHKANNRQQHNLLLIISAISIIIVGVLFFIIRMLAEKNRMNKALESRNVEITKHKDNVERLSQQLEEATNAKLIFYTNISHDLRTPLALIVDPLECIRDNAKLNDEHKSLLKIALKNVNIILRLIEQILDFRRYESDKATLLYSEVDLLHLIKEWTSAFMPTIEQRNKRVVLHSIPDVDYSVTIDQQRIERVYYNLLSNALKYSYGEAPIHIKITTSIINDKNMVGFEVINSCLPSVKDYIENIFDRYYTSNTHAVGSGIGLSVTKVYVELHGGVLEAKYIEESTQFQITVNLPTNRELELKPSSSTFINEVYDSSIPEIELAEIITSDDNREGAKPLILIVDDNEDIRQYISSRLSSEYQTLMAEDGLSGFELAKRYIPDLVICDVMMPVIDGMDLCRELKQELITSHIPILMLTACADDERRLEGYKIGADGYITKPFRFEMLVTRIKNLLENRALAIKNGSQISNRIPLRSDATSQEETFIEAFNNFIEDNYNNAELNVEDIASALCYSRVQLYRKVKAITGEAPNILLRNARLRHADLLLRSSNKTIADVTYEVGFTSPSYFSKSYKDYYGISPSTVAKS